jgi:hypothetical protein
MSFDQFDENLTRLVYITCLPDVMCHAPVAEQLIQYFQHVNKG